MSFCLSLVLAGFEEVCYLGLEIVQIVSKLLLLLDGFGLLVQGLCRWLLLLVGFMFVLAEVLRLLLAILILSFVLVNLLKFFLLLDFINFGRLLVNKLQHLFSIE